MQPRRIEMATYPRKKHFDYFRAMAYPYVGATVKADITDFTTVSYTHLAVGIAVQQRQHALHRVAHLGGQICGKIQLHRHCPLQKLAFQLAINICHGQSPSFSMHCGFGSSIIHRAGAV